jgi:hypothetical protein
MMRMMPNISVSPSVIIARSDASARVFNDKFSQRYQLIQRPVEIPAPIKSGDQ